MSAGADGHLESRLDELYATAREARSRAQGIVERAEVILREAQVAQQAYQRACSRVERLREPLLSAKRDRMPHSAYARMEARLASMPVIEQAKGILMAQRGWTVDEAFDVLRRASQRSNVPVRDLAAKIVASTGPRSGPALPADGAPSRSTGRGPSGRDVPTTP